MIENINWYPGHMKKTRELIKENLKLVDMVIEVIDARIPVSSRNPIIDEITGTKPRLILLNKSDLSDDAENRKWVEHFENSGSHSMTINCMSGSGIKELLKYLEKQKDIKNRDAVRNRPFRLMIVGVPNVGKSSLINRLTGKKSTKTGDRPGVTKGKQWLTLENGMQLLDTPGILWPKFEDPKAGLNLAFCGSIKDEILDVSDLALELIKVLARDYPELLMERYKLDELHKEGDYSEETGAPLETENEIALADMEAISRKRGWILPGKRIDYERAGKTILDEFRSGLIGKISLEKADD